MRRPTALGIPSPSPWNGDENAKTPRAYWAWFWLYRKTRVLRHELGLHDWQARQIPGAKAFCTWCGTRA